MAVRHVLSVADLSRDELARLVDDAVDVAAGKWDGRHPLEGKVVGIYFQKTSTRTRTSFSVGALKLGASIIAYGPNDLQIATGETLPDTARVLANYLDALVVRTNGSLDEMREMTVQDRMAVVNAMSENEHPTQAVADLATLKEHFGRLEDIHILYIGEGNNTTTALALALARFPGMRLTIVTPPGYGISEAALAEARDLAAGASGAQIVQHDRLDDLPKGVDAVYSTRWLTMGVPKADENWLDSFRPYSVTPELMARVSKPGTIFLHDLPAMRGYEVVDEVLDGPQSVAFRQAYHKMTSAMAILAFCTESC